MHDYISSENDPELVETVSELLTNTRTLMIYLMSDDDDLRKYAKDRIKAGFCFLALNTQNGFVFFPSKFIGYKDNSMEKHEYFHNKKMDGTDTTGLINELLSSVHITENDGDCWTQFENQFISFCTELGIVPDNKKRKYWILT